MNTISLVTKRCLFMFLMCAATCSWAQEINSKYLVSIIHLQSDKELNKKIKKTFKKETRKNKSINFQISEKIEFLDPEVFDQELKKDGFSFSIMDQAIKNKNEINHFRKVLSSEKGKDEIFIHFSKPLENLLIVELSNKDFGDQRIKLGKSLRILFLFNEKGFIKKVYTKTIFNN